MTDQSAAPDQDHETMATFETPEFRGVPPEDPAPENSVSFEVAYADLAALRRAVAEGALPVERLRSVEVASAAPLPHASLPEGLDTGHPSAVWPLAALGGLLGCAGMVTLARWTAMDYPIVTGGMPVVAAPPIGIVAFEGTALGAVFATVGTVLWRAGLLPGRRTRPLALAEHLAAGQIVVRFEAVLGDREVAVLHSSSVALTRSL